MPVSISLFTVLEKLHRIYNVTIWSIVYEQRRVRYRTMHLTKVVEGILHTLPHSLDSLKIHAEQSKLSPL